MQFNFHENIIQNLVPLLNDEDEEISNEISCGIRELFKSDRKGNSILLVVRKIAAIVKQKNGNVKKEVVDVLIALRIKEVQRKDGKDIKDKERAKIDRKQV